MTEPPPPPHIIIAGVLSLALVVVPVSVYANPGPIPIPLYWYGTDDDGDLYRSTAFASWHEPPPNVPLTVRPDWRGVALNGWVPGARVRITVVNQPTWTATWHELDDVVGRSTIAYVADRPGGDFGDAWPATFQELAPLWVGRLEVVVESAEREQRVSLAGRQVR